MKKHVSEQYNKIAGLFSRNQSDGEHSNETNRSDFYNHLEFLVPKMKVLDLCCGDGLDANYYKEKGCAVSGIDGSQELIKIAQEKYPSIDFRAGHAEKLPYQKSSFDAVLSKYAIMTSPDMEPIFDEVHRVLKVGGYFAYLVTHPFRQYFENKSDSADYFKQEIVESHILNNSITLHEPTHTLNEYFSKNFLSKFDLIDFKEAFDPAAEKIDGRTYPGYFIAVCQKR